MKHATGFVLAVIMTLSLSAQETGKNTHVVAGVSGPELLHGGVTFRISNSTLIGVNAGIGPSAGTVWPAFSAEHRIYFGKDSRIGRKQWFCRQGFTYYPSADVTDKISVNLTVGKDLLFKNNKSGLTIDAGVFYLGGSSESSLILVRSLNLWPALRFEFYF